MEEEGKEFGRGGGGLGGGGGGTRRYLLPDALLAVDVSHDVVGDCEVGLQQSPLLLQPPRHLPGYRVQLAVRRDVNLAVAVRLEGRRREVEREEEEEEGGGKGGGGGGWNSGGGGGGGTCRWKRGGYNRRGGGGEEEGGIEEGEEEEGGVEGRWRRVEM